MDLPEEVAVSQQGEGTTGAKPEDVAAEGEPLPSLQDVEQRYITRVL